MRPFWRKDTHASLALPTLAILVLLSVGALTIGLHSGTLAALLASATSSLSTSSATVYFTPYDDKPLAVGDTTDIDVNIHTKVPINALGITIKFPEDSLEIVGISKKKSFLDLWTEDTVIKEETGEVHFSGGTTNRGGLNGIGTMVTLTVRAKKEGPAKLSFKEIQILANDGKGTEIDTDKRSYSYEIPPRPTGGFAIASVSAPVPQPTAPNPDLNGDGKINIVDVSILSMRILMGYNPRYDLDMDGTVGLSDLSILFSKMRAQ